MKICFVLLVLITYAQSEAVPIAVFHGIGDACFMPGMLNFVNKLHKMTGAYTRCIEVGTIGNIASWFLDFKEQGQEACKRI